MKYSFKHTLLNIYDMKTKLRNMNITKTRKQPIYTKIKKNIDSKNNTKTKPGMCGCCQF